MWCSLYNRYKYAFGILALMLLYLHAQAPSLEAIRGDGWWLGGFWYVTYGLGFVARGLVGTLVAPIGGKLAPAALNQLIVACWFATACCVAFFGNWLVASAPGGTRLGLLYALVVFVVMPCSQTQYCNSEMLGKLDMFFQPTVMAALLLLLITRRPGTLAVPVAIGIMIHPAFFFVGFPTLLCLALWRAGSRRWLAPLALAVLACALFGWFTLRGSPAGGVTALDSHLAARCTLPQAGNERGFFYAYFATLSDHLTLLRQHGLKFAANTLLVYATVLAPAWLLPLWLWRRAVKASPAQERAMLLVMALGPSAGMLPLLVTLDWTRWAGLLLCCHYLALFYLLLAGCTAVRAAFEELCHWLRRRPAMATAMLLWLALLPRTDVSGLLLNPRALALFRLN